jgi:hypothetical protein
LHDSKELFVLNKGVSGAWWKSMLNLYLTSVNLPTSNIPRTLLLP